MYFFFLFEEIDLPKHRQFAIVFGRWFCVLLIFIHKQQTHFRFNFFLADAIEAYGKYQQLNN